MSTNSASRELQTSIEDIMKKRHYENFNEWVRNFALNLPNIWNDASAKKLILERQESIEKENNSAIVIGRGPSINKHEHLKLLAESDYQGTIVCCDGKLADVLNAGVTPDKFPKFYVVTIDPYPAIKELYEHEIINSYGSKINGVFSILTNPEAIEKAKQCGIQIHWLHSLFDYNEGEKSLIISFRIMKKLRLTVNLVLIKNKYLKKKNLPLLKNFVCDSESVGTRFENK